MPRRVVGVAREISRMRGLHSLDGQDTAATTDTRSTDARVLGYLLAVQRPFDGEGQVASWDGAVQGQVLTHLGGALLEGKGNDARQNWIGGDGGGMVKQKVHKINQKRIKESCI